MKKPITLTKTETIVLTELSEGREPFIIAVSQQTSRRAIDFQLHNIYKKLNVPRAYAAIMKAVELKLIPVPSWARGSE